MSAPPNRIALETALARATTGPVTVLVCALTSLALIFDGFDIQAIGLTAPRLMTEWGIGRPDLVWVLASGLVGMGIGAVVVGDLGDRYGRRRALMASMVMIALMSLCTVHAQGPHELVVWRFLTGLGMGGALPNATALMVEFAPARARYLAVAVTVVGVPVGGMVGSAVTKSFLPVYGWQAVFLVGSILPAVLALTMWAFLPESPRFLATRAGRHAELSALMNRVLGTAAYHGSEQWYLRDEQAARTGVRDLFAPDYRYNTTLIWLIFSANVLATYTFFNWTPTLLTGVGLSMGAAVQGLNVYNIGGVIGAIAGAVAINRFGSRPVLVLLALFACIATFALGWIPIGPTVGLGPLYGLLGLAGACISGQQVQMYTVAANAYPTVMRATGVGSGLGCARLGGVCSSFAGSLVTGPDGGLRPFFIGVSAVLLLTLIGVSIIRCHLVPHSIRKATG